jgi:hypothetical protein
MGSLDDIGKTILLPAEKVEPADQRNHHDRNGPQVVNPRGALPFEENPAESGDDG